MKNIFLLLLMFLTHQFIFAQEIEMKFPEFAGRTYEFLIFQGNEVIKAQQGTIPEGGIFTLSIPSNYAPYTGMSKWLLTNSEQGGGLDLAIPGHGFSVQCLSNQPNDDNIFYYGYDPVNELNRLYREQQLIVEKFEVMNRAVSLYESNSEIYDVFKIELDNLKLDYVNFVNQLKVNSNYNARFLPIVNLTNGLSHQLSEDYEAKMESNALFIADLLNINDLYTSGHWSGIISSWIMLHVQGFGDQSRFLSDFRKISNRINDPKIYSDFVSRVTQNLTSSGQDTMIDLIASDVLKSGKIIQFVGPLAVYRNAIIGQKAPDLIVLSTNGNSSQKIKSEQFAQDGYQKSFLIFYQSGCGPCEDLLNQIPENYDFFKSKGIDIIAVSADETFETFQIKAEKFPWQRSYIDFKGFDGVNFRNYAVMGTPTIYLINKQGIIEKRMSNIEQMLGEAK